MWGIVRRYYEAYLARADERIGLQVRVFPEMPVPFDNMYGQIVRCAEGNRPTGRFVLIINVYIYIEYNQWHLATHVHAVV